MEKRRLGRTTRNISHLCLGLAGADANHISPMLDTAVAAGINWWDLRDGAQIAIIREVLPDQDRDTLVLSAHTRARSSQELQENLQRHLDALQVDYLDILFLDAVRNPDDLVAREEAVAAMLDAKSHGSVRALGLHTNNPEVMRLIGGETTFDVLMASLREEKSLKGNFQIQADTSILAAHRAGLGVVLTDILSGRAGRHDPYGLLEWAVNIPSTDAIRFAPASAAELKALVQFFRDRRVDPDKLKFLWDSAA